MSPWQHVGGRLDQRRCTSQLFRSKFLSTALRFVDAFVAVSDSVFVETKLVSLDIEMSNLSRFD